VRARVRGFWGDITKDQATQFLVGKKEVRRAAFPPPPPFSIFLECTAVTNTFNCYLSDFS
jgi:hypothetical protein